MQTIISSTKKKIISFPLVIWIPFHFLALPLTSCRILNRVVRADILALLKGILSQHPSLGGSFLCPCWNTGTSQEKTLSLGSRQEPANITLNKRQE